MSARDREGKEGRERKEGLTANAARRKDGFRKGSVFFVSVTDVMYIGYDRL